MNVLPHEFVRSLVGAALAEDVGAGDLTAEIAVPADQRAEACIVAREPCVVAGMPRAAINKGYAAKVIALDNIASFLVAQCGVDRAASAPVSDDKLEKNDTLEKSDKKTVSPLRG